MITLRLRAKTESGLQAHSGLHYIYSSSPFLFPPQTVPTGLLSAFQGHFLMQAAGNVSFGESQI